MPLGDDVIRSLRDAVRLSPDNVPLRRSLAQTLAANGLLDEAERELREALVREPANADLKLELARVYFQSSKHSQALVVLEDIVKKADASAAARVLYAKLLLARGDTPNAVAQYKLALEREPECVDLELSRQLGIGADPHKDSVVDGRQRDSWSEADEQRPAVEIERPKITFQDVGGMEELKEEIRLKIIYPLQHPELYKAYGKTAGGGILMYGPPGCGKTHMARATAGEINAGFIAVGISDVLDMWIGASERNLHELFEQARFNRPCVLFFDEVDALGSRRTDMKGAGRQIINQFLSEMDGVERSNEGVLILAATNAPWHVDPAFRRPGRFDRVLFVPPPDNAARSSVLRIQCRNKPLENVDFEQLAKQTEHFSGADLKAVIDQAVEMKLREAMKRGIPTPLTTKDLAAAAKSLKPTTREWFTSARNYAVYSNQGGLYDDVLKYLKL